MAKPKNKGNNLTKKHKKHPPQKNFSGGGGGSSKKRKREDSPDAVSFSNKGNYGANKKSKSQNAPSRDYENDEPASIVYIRQRVPHRRLLFFIEQALMKHNFGLHRQLDPPQVQVSPQHNQLMLSFSGSNHAKKCVNLLNALLPVNHTSDGSGGGGGSSGGASGNSGTSSEQTHFTVEVAPICIGDLVVLPPSLYTSMGQFGPIVLCWRINETLSFINVENLRVGEITSYHYFNTKDSNQKTFRSLMTDKNLIEYTVIDVEKVMTTKGNNNDRVVFKNGKFELAEVSICKTSELGQSDAIIQVKSHLGAVLQAGDRVLGYDLQNANLNNEHLEGSAYKHVNLPDVVLVRKIYEKPKRRYWLLKPGAVHACSNDEDYEQFLDELEDDEEMRKKVNMYRDPNYAKKNPQLESVGDDDDEIVDGDGDVELEDGWKNVPHVRLEELLDSLSLSF